MDRCQAWWLRVVGFPRDIRVGHVQAHHDLAFQSFHPLGLRFGFVIVAGEVEKTVHREMCKVMKKDTAFILWIPVQPSRRQ